MRLPGRAVVRRCLHLACYGLGMEGNEPRRLMKVLQASLMGMALLITAVCLPAQHAPPWQVLRGMEVTGSGYERDDIAGTLATDFETTRTLQRALDDVTAQVVADRVAIMHRVGGYPAATAVGEVVNGSLRIAVQPGARYRWGEVRCAGNTMLRDEQLAGALSKPSSATMSDVPFSAALASQKALLSVGEFANTTPSMMKRLQEGAIAAYETIGRYGAEIQIAHEHDHDKLALLVTVASEGREVVHGALELDGEPDAETAAAVIAWVAPKPGALLTKPVLSRIRRRIEATARYADVEVVVPESSSASQSPLIVKVVRIPEPPPFDEVQLANAAWVDRALERSLAGLRGGELLQAGVEVRESLPMSPVLTVHPGRVQLTFGIKGMRLEGQRVSWGGGPPERFALQIDPHGLSLTAGRSESIYKTSFGELLSVQLQLTSTLPANGQGEIRWGFGAASGDYPEFFSDMHPSFAMRVLRSVDEVREVASDLELIFGETKMRLGAAGELRDQPIGFAVDGNQFTVGMVSELPSAQAVADNNSAAVPAAALHKILVAVLGQTVAHPTEQERLRAMARGVIDAWPKPIDASDEPDDSPSLAGESGQPPSMVHVFAGFVQLPCVVRSYSGGLLEVCACASSYLAGDSRTAGAALKDLAEKRKAGPLLLLPLSLMFRATNNERHANLLRDLSRRRWNFDAIWSDAADLLANVPWLAAVPANAGAAFRKDQVLQRLFAELPDGPNADTRAFRIAVRYWWSHGGEGMLKQLLLD